jgi:NTP pyrophosphatase (non-canonical NTP hydrolase)
MELSKLQHDSWAHAEKHGFHGDEITNDYFAAKCMLIVSEVAEAMEEHRAGKKFVTYYNGDSKKPEGVPAELADIVIRVCDLAEICGINLTSAIEEKSAYNSTRPYKHGKIY